MDMVSMAILKWLDSMDGRMARGARKWLVGLSTENARLLRENESLRLANANPRPVTAEEWDIICELRRAVA